MKVVKGITNKSDEEVLDIVSLRFAKNDDMESFVGALMEADEALQLLDRDDIRVIKQENLFLLFCSRVCEMYGPVIATLCCMLFCLTGALFVLFSCVYTYALMHTLLFVFDCCFVLLCVIVVFMFYPKQCLQLGWCWYDCVLWSRCCIVCWFGLVWFLVPKSCGTIMVHQIPFNK